MRLQDDLRSRLTGRPDVTTVSPTTLFMRGQVDRVETAPGSMGLHIPSRHTIFSFRDSPRRSEQPFSAWFDQPTHGTSLPNRDLLFVTDGSVVMLHTPGWHVGSDALRSVSTDVVLESPCTHMVVAVQFSVYEGVRQNISVVYLGSPREVRRHSTRSFLYLENSRELKASGLTPTALPVSLEFSGGNAAYALPDGSAVVFCQDKVVFFIA